jgi:hypothetical protein
MAVLPRDLENRGETLEVRMAEKHPEPVSHQTLTDVVVPVAVRRERCFGVVDVEAAKAVESDRPVEFVENSVERRRVGDVVAGRVQVARVQTHPEARMSVEQFEQEGELVE